MYLFIIDNQNLFLFALAFFEDCGGGLRFPGCTSDILSSGRQIEGKGCSLDIAFYQDLTIVVVNGVPDHGQAQAGTAATHDFFTVKGFKNMGSVICRNAGTGVADEDCNIFSAV